MSLNETTTREGSDQDDQDSETASALLVNLAESDPKKAIERSELATNDEGGEERTPRNHKERKDEFAKRIGRLERNFDQRIAERDAEHQRELREMRGEINGLKAKRVDADAAADEATHNAKIEDLEGKLADALEAGDSKLTAKLQSAIAAEHARFASAQTARAMGEAYEKDQATKRGGDDTGQRGNGPAPMGKRFLSANADWWNDPVNRRKRAAVVDIDKELLAEDYDPNTAEYYEELQARFSEEYPDFEIALPGERRAKRRQQVDDDDDDDLTMNGPRRTAVRTLSASANRGSSTRTVNSRGQVVLNKSDIANMQKWGFDPDKPADVLTYVAERGG